MTTTIAGRFEVLETLGEGGQGAVYAVRDPQRPDAALALKVLRAPGGGALLRLEFERLQALAHPGFARALEWIADADGEPAYLCERIEGQPLREAIAAAGAPGSAARATRALELAEPLLRALQQLHAAGYVHLDLKPENVVVRGEQPVLLDLGFSARSGELAQRGTPAYAAPEVRWGWPVDRRADLWSLAATLAQAIGEGAPGELDAVPEPARGFLATLLRDARTQRPGSAGEALVLLGAALGRSLPDAPAELPAIEGPLLERDDALDALAQDGLAFVVGPPGSGRSRLLREAAAARRRVGQRVVHLRFAEPAPPGPFGALGPLLARLGVRADAGGTAEQARARVVVDACAGLAAFVAEGPCVLACDDVDQADADALELTVALARAAAELRAAVWLSWSGDPPTALARLQKEHPGAPRLELSPAAEVARERPALPEGEPRALLDALALLGRPLAFAELASWCATADAGSPLRAALDAVPQLLEAGHLQRVGGEALALAPGVRAHLSPGAETAQALRLLPGWSALEGARLALLAGDAQAAAEVTAAARAAQASGALGAAAGLLARLLELALDPAQRAPAQRLAAEVAFARGDEQAGLALLEAVLADEAAPDLERARAAGLAARRRYRLAEDDAALALAARAEALAADAPAPDLRCDVAHVRALVRACQDPQTYSPDPGLLKRLREQGASGDALAKLGTALGIVLYRSNRLAEAEPILTRASRDASSAAPRGWALLNLGVCLQREGRDADAERATADARALLESAGDVVGVATADLESGLRLLRQSRYRACAGVLEPVLATFRALGDTGRVAELRLNLGAAWLRMGGLQKARAHLEAAAEGLKEPGLRAFCAGDLAWLEAEALRDDAAQAQLERGSALAADADPFFALQGAIQATIVRVRLGAADEALGLARDALARVRETGTQDLEAPAALALAEAAVAAGDAATAREAAAVALASPSERARAGAALARALLLAGEVAPAKRAARQAVDAAADTDDVFDRCFARLALARALEAGGDAAGARAELAGVAAVADGRLPRLAREVAGLTREPLSALEVSLACTATGGGLLAKVVAGAPDAGHMLDLSLGLLVEATGAERGLLVLLDDALQPTETAARNMRDEELSGIGSSYSRRLVHAAAEGGEPVLVPDALVDPRFTEAESVATLAIRSVLALPVGDGDVPLAVLYLDDRTQPGRFGPDDLELAARLTGELAPALRLARERLALQRDVAGLRSRVAEATLHAATREIVGESAPIRELRVAIARASRTALPVLVEGESGSGKELIARAIHQGGVRAQGPFVAESCAAVADELLESEFFGHVRGAFTGADRDREGIFAQASGGTLFLDEVNSMSPSMQAKLLRVLQEGVVRPVGAEATRRVDVRVIAASNEPLTACVAEGRFREDLYYRLAVMGLRAPPLRERPDDVPLLLDHFLRKHGEGDPPQITDAALRTLVAYPWPGNVRELENAVRRLHALRVGRVLVRHLPAEVQAASKDARPGQDPASAASELPLGEALERLERDLIARALRRCQGNVSQAARQLGIERTKLTRRIKRLGIEGP